MNMTTRIDWTEKTDSQMLSASSQVRIILSYQCLPFTCPNADQLRSLAVDGFLVHSSSIPKIGNPRIEGITQRSMSVAQLKSAVYNALSVLSGNRSVPLSSLSVDSILVASEGEQEEEGVTITTTLTTVAVAAAVVVIGIIVLKVL